VKRNVQAEPMPARSALTRDARREAGAALRDEVSRESNAGWKASAGDAAMIAGYLGEHDRFDAASAQLAHSDADQNERDHDALRRAVRDGRIEAVDEPA